MNILPDLQGLLSSEHGRQSQTLLCLLHSVSVLRGRWWGARRIEERFRRIEPVGGSDGADETIDHEVPVSERTALLALYLTHFHGRVSGEAGLGVGRRRRHGLRGDSLCRNDAVCVFAVQFTQPEGELVPVFLGEGWVHESQRQELPALVQVVLRVPRAEEDLGQQSHVLFPCVCVSWIEKREVCEQLLQGLVLRLTV